MSTSHHSTPRRNAKKGATPPPADKEPELAPETLSSPTPPAVKPHPLLRADLPLSGPPSPGAMKVRPSAPTSTPPAADPLLIPRALVLHVFDHVPAGRGTTRSALVLALTQPSFGDLDAERAEGGIASALRQGYLMERAGRLYRSGDKPATLPESPAPSPAPAAKPSTEERRKRRFDLYQAELAALGVADHHNVERLDELTTLQLFAVAFCDGGDVDPAAEMMRSLCDDLALLGTIYNPGTRLEIDLSAACLGRVFYRLENRARVAEELHRRQREALLDVTERVAR